ncbi:3-deoxy-manno-octulosonate cytidylyltransferase [Sphingomonas sp. HITSZ_GF]|uniref:3-deoxy-manno-octulosonate cytidylyltransferase family protein n=1 Tax=Sphingomonas sp. HITSZ_GF TaxID=3037247 RepID=UPI00240E7B72|nr:manno-octulosonate cytidylyltransferase [Sphingomonas sp. HITSZ_GF]MDG2533780.1 3-deoxy-manno-octulosonate cytidylyltransferase [Sphingomonas sp. HITSZ_GF]
MSDLIADRPAEVLIVVPARFASVRFPGKPLALLGEKPLVQWTWEAAMRASDLGDVVVATEDERIAEAVRGFGGTAVMTGAAARNGTERCAEVAARRPGAKLVINLQGDSPLVRRSDIAALVDAWRATGAAMLTPWLACDAATEARLLADAAAGRVGGTTVVADRAGNALYFSKRVLPHGARPKLHIGLYAYTPAALAAYAGWAPGALELAEGLEQLRFLENGMGIRLVEVPAPEAGFWEVNNAEDVPLVASALGGAVGL